MSDSLYLASIYRIHGVTFWESAKTLSEKIEVDAVGIPKRVTAIPFYFLASHAAELLLKSALLKRGFSERDLKQFSYRHSLKGLLDALQGKWVSVTPPTIAMVSGLHDQHSMFFEVSNQVAALQPLTFSGSRITSESGASS